MSEFQKALEEVTAAAKDDPFAAAFMRVRKDDRNVAPGIHEATRKLDRGASGRTPEDATKTPAGWERDPALRHYLAMNRSPAFEFLFANRTPRIT